MGSFVRYLGELNMCRVVMLIISSDLYMWVLQIFLGTDVAMVRCFSLESRTVVHEIKTDPQFPR
jgi:hypothetical protein